MDLRVASSLGITLKVEVGAVGLPPSSKTLPCDLRLPNLMPFSVGAISSECECVLVESEFKVQESRFVSIRVRIIMRMTSDLSIRLVVWSVPDKRV